MRNKLINILFLAVGAAIGSAVTWKFLKTKYEQIAQEEIDSVKEVYLRKSKEDTETLESVKQALEKMGKVSKPIQDSYEVMKEKISNLGYSSIDEEGKEREQMPIEKPYVISPDVFGDADGYDVVSLNYYADGVLTDDWGDIIGNVDDIVGEESLTHFGEYEDDSVFVRNDRLKTDYEILKDERNFSDIKNPYEMED